MILMRAEGALYRGRFGGKNLGSDCLFVFNNAVENIFVRIAVCQYYKKMPAVVIHREGGQIGIFRTGVGTMRVEIEHLGSACRITTGYQEEQWLHGRTTTSNAFSRSRLSQGSSTSNCDPLPGWL